MQKSLKLPKHISAQNIHKVLPLLDLVVEDSKYWLNADAFEFVDPFGLCILAACCDKLQQQDRELPIRNLQQNQQNYLTRMDLFKQCGLVADNLKRNDLSNNLLEIQCLEHHQDAANVAAHLSHAVVGGLPDYDENAKPDDMTGYKPHEQLEENLCYVLNEVLENAVTHARQHGYTNSKVWVACQYYSRNDMIRLGIVDTGCGFLRSLEKHPKKPNTHEEALLLALQPRVSCNREVGLRDSEAVNQGIGLTVTQRIVNDAGGTLYLLSGDTQLTVKPQSRPESKDVYWQGSALGIEVKREDFKQQLVNRVILQLQNDQPPPVSDIDIAFI